jgi:hypothetical protein
MTPIPTLPDLVREVILDGLDGPRDPIRQIGQAERLAGELTHLGESLVGYFVEQARAEGQSWADIGAPRGLSRQGAQQRYAPLLTHLAVADLVEAGALRQLGEAALAALHRAEERAARLGRDAIDSGDLLLGVLDDDRSQAVAAIRELGIDPTLLRSELEGPEEGEPKQMWHRAPADPGATSEEQGAAQGTPSTGGGKSEAGDGGASVGGASVGGASVGGASVGGASVGSRGESGDREPSGWANALPLSAETRRAIDGAVAEARGHLVGPGHLLLGMLRNPGGRAGRVLRAHGVTKSSAMGAILAVGGRQSADRG